MLKLLLAVGVSTVAGSAVQLNAQNFDAEVVDSGKSGYVIFLLTNFQYLTSTTKKLYVYSFSFFLFLFFFYPFPSHSHSHSPSPFSNQISNHSFRFPYCLPLIFFTDSSNSLPLGEVTANA